MDVSQSVFNGNGWPTKVGVVVVVRPLRSAPLVRREAATNRKPYEEHSLKAQAGLAQSLGLLA